MIEFAEIGVGAGGVRCTRCHGPAEAASHRASGDIAVEISEVCARWSSAPGPNVMLVGGEPFGHPELPRIVASAVAAGCERLGVHSDASALRSEHNCAGALSAGLRHLRVTVLAGTPGLHDALLDSPGASDVTMAGVDAFRSRAEGMGLAMDLQAVVPVCRHNIHDVPSTVALAAAHGFDRVLLRLEDGGLGILSSAPWMRAACDTGVVNGVWVEVQGLPFCAVPTYELHLADVMRPRAGSKSNACERCPVDQFCGGAAAGTAPDQLTELDPDVSDPALARSLAVARGEAGRR